jgi:prefoldin subunit 5
MEKKMEARNDLIGKTIYLVNGEMATLLACTNNKFLVTPIFEGTAMEVSGDGCFHHEMEMDYEHEGFPILVNEIFEIPPTEKIDKGYKELVEKYNKLLSDREKLLSEMEELKTKNDDYNKILKIIEDSTDKLKDEKQKLEVDVNTLVGEISKLKLEKNDIQSSIEGLSGYEKSEELSRLRKKEYMLDCLENAGVDNWDGYEFAIDAYNEEYGDE